MSIYVTSLVWKFSRSSGSTLLTALAIADFSDDDGRSYPSVATLAKKARISERSTQYALAQLRDLDELIVETGNGPHGCNTYHVQVQNLLGANSAGLQNAAERGAASCTQTVIEPSVKKKERARARIGFDMQAGNFTALEAEDLERWEAAYPGVSVNGEITRAACWLISNPSRLKTDNRRFINNWLGRAHQDLTAGRGNRIPSQPSAAALRDAHRDAFGARFGGKSATFTPAKEQNIDFIDVVATPFADQFNSPQN